MALTTSSNLLRDLLDPKNEVAWHHFVDTYMPRIRRQVWREADSRGLSLSKADLDEYAQDIAGHVAVAMRRGKYDPARRRHKGAFRSWLSKVTHRAMGAILEKRPREMAAGGDQGAEALAQVPDRFEQGLAKAMFQHTLMQAVAVAEHAYLQQCTPWERVVIDHLGWGQEHGNRKQPGQPKYTTEHVARMVGRTPDQVRGCKQRAKEYVRKSVLDQIKDLDSFRFPEDEDA
jgi:DNA-directed RNA polymerase specialized sigma24 family protein